MPDDLTEEALAALYPTSQPVLMRGLCSRFHLSVEDAEEVVQDTFLATCLVLRTGKPINAQKAPRYLWRIARNRAIDLLRHRAVVPMVALEGMPEPLGLDVADEVEARELLHAVLSALSPSQRQAVLGQWAGYSAAEMAATEQVSLSTINQHLWKARRVARERREAA